MILIEGAEYRVVMETTHGAFLVPAKYDGPWLGEWFSWKRIQEFKR